MPFSPDGLPIIGKIDALPGNAFIISGMGSAGMMQGPGGAKYLTDLINGCEKAKTILEPASPARFSNTEMQLQNLQINAT